MPRGQLDIMVRYLSDGCSSTAIYRVYISAANEIVQSMTVCMNERPHEHLPDQGSIRPSLPVGTGPVETELDLDMDPAMSIFPIRPAAPVRVAVQAAATPVAPAPTPMPFSGYSQEEIFGILGASYVSSKKETMSIGQ
jgi:hypothetical protein